MPNLIKKSKFEKLVKKTFVIGLSLNKKQIIYGHFKTINKDKKQYHL